MKNKIKQYLKLFEQLDTYNIDNFNDLVDEQIIFVDPFNKIVGKEKFIKLFKKNITAIQKPKFMILSTSSQNREYFVKWRMEFFAFGKNQKIIGISEIKVNETGLISSHYDYWDSFNQFYLKLPILGNILKILYNVIKSKL